MDHSVKMDEEQRLDTFPIKTEPDSGEDEVVPVETSDTSSSGSKEAATKRLDRRVALLAELLKRETMKLD